MRKLTLASALAICLLPASTYADIPEASTGPYIKQYGKAWPVKPDQALPENTTFNVAFDAVKSGKPGEVNRSFNSLARFLNMHGKLGVKRENMKLALVVHGGATLDLLNDRYFYERSSAKNPNTELLNLLAENGVEIYICGQSASRHGVEKHMLNKNVNMAVSAMTAHALLQQKGYTVNPF